MDPEMETILIHGNIHPSGASESSVQCPVGPASVYMRLTPGMLSRTRYVSVTNVYMWRGGEQVPSLS